jgi:uncharacterized protein
MRMLIDIGHPAHVHLFKNIVQEFVKKGNEVLFTTREKEFEIGLLKSYRFNFISFGKHYQSIFGKLIGLIKFDFLLLIVSIRFKPDIFLSHGSPYASHVAFFTGKPHISFEDTFNFEQIKLYRPFIKVILTADYPHPSVGKNEIRYSGYHELSYLHPNVFKPSFKALNSLKLKANEKFVILRFVSWSSTHDLGHKGFSSSNKLKVVNEFSKYAKVFISSEKHLPQELEKYRIPIAPEQIHDAIAFSSLMFGESATMVSEAAVLGVPGIYIDNTGRYYTKEQQEKYGLVFNFTESAEGQINAIKKGVEILSGNEIRENWQLRRSKLLADKIDVTAFSVWFIENYPQSIKVMKENPEYQKNFR